MYKHNVLEAKHNYEAFFHQYDPAFEIQINLEDLNNVYDYNYRDSLDESKQSMMKQMEIKTNEITQRNKKKCNEQIKEQEMVKKQTIELEKEVERMKESSQDIESALSAQDSHIERDKNEVYIIYQDLKKSINNAVGENSDGLVKKIIEEFIKVTRYMPVEKDLEEVELLFKNSGHDEWTKQLRLQTAVCYLDQDTLTERLNTCISNLDSAYSYENLDLLYCIKAADRLSKYALAKEYYYDGDFSVENLDLLSLKSDSKDKVNAAQTIALASTSLAEKPMIETKNHLPPPPATTSVPSNDTPKPKSGIDLRQWVAHINTKEKDCKCLWCKHVELKYCIGNNCLYCRDLKEHRHHCANSRSTGVFKSLLNLNKKRCKPCERIHIIEKSAK